VNKDKLTPLLTINSGPVTGGVLRGEKSRFQLFGGGSGVVPQSFGVVEPHLCLCESLFDLGCSSFLH